MISISEDSIFTPNSSTASGISATDGIGRRNSTVEFVTRRRNGDDADDEAQRPWPGPPR